MLTRARVATTGAVLVAAALALTGCGGSDGGDETATTSGSGSDESSESSQAAESDVDPQDDPAAYFQAVSDATKEAGSYRLDTTMTSDATGDQTVESLATYHGDDLVTQISGSALGPGAEDTRIVQTADAIYMMGMPDVPPEIADKWLKIDLGSEFAQMFGGGGSTDMLDVNIFTQYGDLDITAADGEEVDGVSTQEISFTLTADQLAGAIPADSPVADLAKDQLQDTDYVLSVGDDLLIREMHVTSGDLLSMDASMYDYGTDETVEIPAEGDTVDFEEYFQDLAGGATGG